jgi:hypothetical protein
MPTLNPRVNVTLSPSLDLLVGRFALVQRVSKAQVLRELLEAAEPALQRAVLLMEAAASAGSGVLAGLASSLGKAQADLEGRLDEALAMADGSTADLVTQAQALRSRRPTSARPRAGAETAGAQKNPPASNRGVKSHNRSTAKRRKQGAKK